MIASGLVPTRRAVIDINRPCNARCRMCYYTYSQGEQWSKSLDDVRKELRAAKERGNTSVDFTGGEPTIYPEMAEAIRYAESIGLHTCIITNGLAVEKVKKLADAGCSEWLLSVHGFEERQDQLLNVRGAWDKSNRTARHLVDSGCFVRINCTLTRYNFEDLPRLAKHYHDAAKPRVVNFINFNPHYEWGKHRQPEIVERLNEVQVRASEVAPHLKEAIEYLDAKNYWVNVRYFPLCLLKGFESRVCNNPQVMFDPFEWDYGVAPKTTEVYLAHGREFQKRINTDKGACATCGMLNVCGGLHANYAQLHGFSELEPYAEQSDYPYHFKDDLAADIVVPAFKPGENLQKLLAEIAEKTVPPYNLIVVSRQQSAAKNRNAGLRASQNPYVIMCDDDIADLSPGWNRELVWAIKENRELAAVSARLMGSDGTVGRNTANHFDLGPRIADVDMIPTACCIFRKTDVLFDERYIRAGWEDTDYFMQLRQKYGGHLAIANTIRVTHLNEEKNDGGVENTHNRDLYFAKWVPDERENAPPRARDAADAPDLDSLKGAVLINPQDTGAFRRFIRASYGARRFGPLEDCLRNLLQDHSSAKELQYLLADCLFEQGRPDEALEAARKIAAAFPDYAPAKLLLDKIDASRLQAAPTVNDKVASRLQGAPTEKSSVVQGANGGGVKADSAFALPGPRARMKLLVGPGLFDPRGNEAFLVKALKRAADVRTFDHTPARFEDVLRNLPTGWTPDAVLIRDSEYYRVPPGLESVPYPVFCLLGDYNLSFNQMLPVLGAFDHFFCDLKGVRIFRKLGFDNCDFFCLYGFDPELHRDPGRTREWDVLFIGNLNHSVQQEREEALYELGRLGEKYRVHIGSGIFGADYARLLGSSKLVFNRPIRDEANMRFFEALACGALVLNPRIEELDLLGFRPGEHYLHYDALGPAIGDYLEKWPVSKKEQTRENVRRVLEAHSYDRRALDLVEKISAAPVDISRRRLAGVPKEEAARRWALHHGDEIDLNGSRRLGRFDPSLVGWQKHLVKNELEIKNFDFAMWTWWTSLLAASGLKSYLASFLDEKERLLESFGCYGEVAAKIAEAKTVLAGTESFFDSTAQRDTHINDKAETGRM
ncbi:MAG: radical SAM protein [Syntrophobacteraceae bacterium]